MITLEIINWLLEHPYEQFELLSRNGDYKFKEIFKHKENHIYVEIKCTIGDNENQYGSVYLNINIDNFTKKKKAVFEYLEVNSLIVNKGIGSQLMFKVFENVSDIKTYYSIGDKVDISGWLSQSDNQNGNWEKSIPFYVSISRKANVDYYFTVKGVENKTVENKISTAKEFFDNINNNGYIVYRL